jgi:hypothetical protein
MNGEYLKHIGYDNGNCEGKESCYKKAVMRFCGNMIDFPYHEDWMSNLNNDKCAKTVYAKLGDW